MDAMPRKKVSDILGMPPLAKEGRERILASAIELFYRHGFTAVGLDRILAEAGVSKTTFYKHYESKDELMVAAVRQRDEWESRAWLRAIKERGGDDAAQQMLAWIDLLDEWFNATDYAGCIFTNAAMEFPSPHDPVHQAAAEHFQNVCAHWNAVFTTAGAKAAEAQQLADSFIALVSGALILRQANSRNDAARAIRPAVLQLVKGFLPARDVNESAA